MRCSCAVFEALHVCPLRRHFPAPQTLGRAANVGLGRSRTFAERLIWVESGSSALGRRAHELPFVDVESSMGATLR